MNKQTLTVIITTVVTVLVVLALVTIVAAAAFLAGPVPVEGPAPGFAI